MICKRCNLLMKNVMQFESDKRYQFQRCPKCHYESKKIPLFFKSGNTKQNKCIKNKFKNISLEKNYKKENDFKNFNARKKKQEK